MADRLTTAEKWAAIGKHWTIYITPKTLCEALTAAEEAKPDPVLCGRCLKPILGTPGAHFCTPSNYARIAEERIKELEAEIERLKDLTDIMKAEIKLYEGVTIGAKTVSLAEVEAELAERTNKESLSVAPEPSREERVAKAHAEFLYGRPYESDSDDKKLIRAIISDTAEAVARAKAEILREVSTLRAVRELLAPSEFPLAKQAVELIDRGAR